LLACDRQNSWSSFNYTVVGLYSNIKGTPLNSSPNNEQTTTSLTTNTSAADIVGDFVMFRTVIQYPISSNEEYQKSRLKRQ